MFSSQLKKILNLIKTTGDRVVVYDSNVPDEAYVLMNFDDYASRIGAKSNPSAPLNLPVSDKVEKPELKEELKTDITIDTVKDENLTEEDLADKINREISVWKNREDVSFLNEDSKVKKVWAIPSQVKDKAQEVKN